MAAKKTTKKSVTKPKSKKPASKKAAVKKLAISAPVDDHRMQEILALAGEEMRARLNLPKPSAAFQQESIDDALHIWSGMTADEQLTHFTVVLAKFVNAYVKRRLI